jgi:hypothetical protein
MGMKKEQMRGGDGSGGEAQDGDGKRKRGRENLPAPSIVVLKVRPRALTSPLSSTRLDQTPADLPKPLATTRQ